MTDQTAAPVEGQATDTTTATTSEPAKAWYDGMDFKPEEVGYIQNKAWDSPAKAVKSYIELEKYRGVPPEQLLTLPKDNDPEAWGKVYSRLGRPEAADKYGEVALPEELKGAALDPTRMSWADKIAFDIGLSKTQRDALIAETVKFEAGTVAEMQKAHQEQVTAQQTQQMEGLKNEWGANFSERAELAKRAARAYLPGDETTKETMLNAMEGALGSAAMLKLFANIGSSMSEDKVPAGGADGRPFGYTREQAMADRQSLMSELGVDKTRLASYNSGKGPDFDKMQKLNKIISQ